MKSPRTLCAILALAAAGAASAEAPRNLLLVTLDTVRADALGCNGSRAGATPRLDALARDGVNFTRARTPVPLTLPAHASLLTGLYPPAHGLRVNGAGPLAAEHRTLAETLSASGWRTAAFVASFVLDRRFGLARGFDLYDDRVGGGVADLESLTAERRGDLVLTAFASWLAGLETGRPFFAWVHLYDPHAPYEPPEPYRTRFAHDPYLGEVAYADSIVGGLVDELAGRGLLGRTLVAVVADHGEGRGEHQEGTHGLLIYNSTLHVPMLLFSPGLLPRGVRVDRLTRTIDLAPTLLDYLGRPPALGEGASTRPLIEAAALRRTPDAAERTSYGESLYPALHLGWSELRGLESGDHRVILAPEPELYDVVRDPAETANLAASSPALLARLAERLRAEVGDAGLPAADEPAADAETVARLRGLGYLSGGRRAASAGSGVPARDPKRHMDFWNALERAVFQFGRGDYRGALAGLESLAATDLAAPMVDELLGACRMRLEDWAAAEATYRRVVGRGLGTAAIHLDLGRLLGRRGELAGAERELRRALDLDPLSVPARFELGEVLRRRGRLAEAAGEHRRALETNPRYVYAWHGLGRALAAGGDDAGALDAFRRAVEIDPEEAVGHYNLAVQLERLARRGEAAAAYRRFLDLADAVAFEAERRLAADALARLE